MAEMFKNRDIFRISSPVLISLLAQNIVGVTDTAFLGRLGEIALGGSAMASMCYFCIFTLGFGLGSGTQILIARRYGEKRYSDIGKIFGQSTILLVGAGILSILISYWIGAPTFKALLKSEAVAAAATEYWNWRIWGFIFAFQTATYRSFYVGIGKTKVLTYNSFIMALVNVFLDYALIFGKLGFPALGIKGAAIASVAAEVVSLAFYFIYTHSHKSHLKFKLNKLPRSFDPQLMKKIFNLSFYIMLQALGSMMVWSIFFFLIEKLGERPLAIATITRSVYIFLYIPISAFGTAVNTMVGQLIGRGGGNKVTQQVLQVAKLSVITMGIVAIFMNLFPELLIRIFTPDMSLVYSAVPSLRVISLALVVSSVGNMFFSAVSATGATKKAMNIEFATIFFYLAYTWLFTHILHADVHWCFTVEIVYYIAVGILSYKFIAGDVWKAEKWRQLVE